MNRLILFFALLVLFSACHKKESVVVTPPNPVPTDTLLPIRGVDLSFLPEIEQNGTVFYGRDGAAADVLTIFKENGWNTVRIRLWHKPANAHSALPEVAALAQRVKAKGMKVWLDLHYSDTWTDPGHQSTPLAWKNLSQAVLKDSVYNYTKAVLALVQPEYVQIGNEINGGFLWEKGRINNATQFSELLSRGIKAARDQSPNAKIIVHFAGIDGADWFYNLLHDHQIDYDIIGLSYYPIYHGKDLNTLSTTIQNLSATYQKEIVLAEVAYPFTLGWNDYTNNVLGLDSQCIPAYPATQDGQKAFLTEIKTIMQNCNTGSGFCYWGAEWIAFKGPTASDASSWENQALFDFAHKALPAIGIFQ